MTVHRSLAFRLVLAAMFLALAAPAGAVQPDEILDDPVLEDRARDLSSGLRCLVCRNESIDESNAELARDLRLMVRERLVAGDSDDEVLAYVVERYGEYVLLRPTMNGSNIVLWLMPIALLLVGGGLSLAYVRRRAASAPAAEAQLSPEEQARIRDLLRE